MNLIHANKKEIMTEWRKRVMESIPLARHQSRLTLEDSLPDFLDNLSKLAIFKDDPEQLTVAEGKEDLIGRVHGQHRAISRYSIEQMISEYFILEDVVLEFLKEHQRLNYEVAKKISKSIQKMIQSSAAQFSKSILDNQETFVINLTHDIRSPLMALKMNIDILKRKSELNAESCEKLDRLITKMNSMIEHLLSTIRAQHHHLDFQLFDLVPMVENIIVPYADLYPGIIQTKIAPITVKWNKLGMERVIENLLTNALKYGDTTQPITIEVKSDQETVFFSIHNYGNPIPPELQLSLFDKFKRAAPKSQKKGWGIGLSYVKSVVEAHRGVILVHSSENEGTVFKFEIPINLETALERSNELH